MSKISNNFLDKIILIILIILISGASILSDFNESLFVVLFIFTILTIIKKIKIDKIILIIILFWTLINIFSINNNSYSFSSNEFLGVIIRLLIAYLGIKIIGNNFWGKFENLIYKMVLISLPLYTLNVLFPEIFNSMTPIFKPFTSEVFYRKEIQANYWYSFFYTNSGRGEIRNSGFMFEPGAFAMIIIIAIISNWVTSGVIFNKKIYLYVLALITTLSTMGYISLFILIISFYIYKKKTYILLVFIAFIMFFNFSINSIDFLGPKLNSYLEEYDSNTIYEQGYSDRLEANRVLYFSICIKKSLEYPFGYGVLDTESTSKSSKIVGVNGLGEILVEWGWLGVVFLIISIYNFCKSNYFNIYITFLFSIIILLTFFSNPIERNLILFIIILTPFIIKKNKL